MNVAQASGPRAALGVGPSQSAGNSGSSGCAGHAGASRHEGADDSEDGDQQETGRVRCVMLQQHTSIAQLPSAPASEPIMTGASRGARHAAYTPGGERVQDIAHCGWEETKGEIND